ncbi:MULTISPECIES: transposase [Olivibacter]|uniref:Transposase n=1 Tax=Olivibacter jilunii TaxID=985016 RepID=A0ABW6B151_9SPHI|nr:transposase [Olivibacter sp. 47]MDM8173800.1 transposase [Olivibacter sp. 47]
MEYGANYIVRAETWLFITTLVYFLMNGAQIFETAVIVPKWTASPPESFQLLGGRYGLNLKTFWIVVHTIHEITFVVALIFCWKIMPIRNWLLLLFFLHMAVRAWTLMYFAPNIMTFQDVANGAASETDLLDRANLWRTLNYIRVSIFILISCGLIPLYISIINMKTR